MTTRDQTAELLQAILIADRRKRSAALKILNGDLPLSPDPDQPLMMKAGPAIHLLGVSKATFWRLVQSGRLRSVPITNKATFFRRRDIEALVYGDPPGAAANDFTDPHRRPSEEQHPSENETKNQKHEEK